MTEVLVLDICYKQFIEQGNTFEKQIKNLKNHWHDLSSRNLFWQISRTTKSFEQTLRKIVIRLKNIEEPMKTRELKDVCLIVLDISFYQVLEQALKTSQK